MWLGDPPLALHKLTFVESLLIARHYTRCYVFKLYPKDGTRGYRASHLQRGMAGNVTLYKVNTSAITSMLEGALLPQSVNMLSSCNRSVFFFLSNLQLDYILSYRT